jgi:hypothetical protein
MFYSSPMLGASEIWQEIGWETERVGMLIYIRHFLTCLWVVQLRIAYLYDQLFKMHRHFWNPTSTLCRYTRYISYNANSNDHITPQRLAYFGYFSRLSHRGSVDDTAQINQAFRKRRVPVIRVCKTHDCCTSVFPVSSYLTSSILIFLPVTLTALTMS